MRQAFQQVLKEAGVTIEDGADISNSEIAALRQYLESMAPYTNLTASEPQSLLFIPNVFAEGDEITRSIQQTLPAHTLVGLDEYSATVFESATDTAFNALLINDFTKTISPRTLLIPKKSASPSHKTLDEKQPQPCSTQNNSRSAQLIKRHHGYHTIKALLNSPTEASTALEKNFDVLIRSLFQTVKEHDKKGGLFSNQATAADFVWTIQRIEGAFTPSYKAHFRHSQNNIPNKESKSNGTHTQYHSVLLAKVIYSVFRDELIAYNEFSTRLAYISKTKHKKNILKKVLLHYCDELLKKDTLSSEDTFRAFEAFAIKQINTNVRKKVASDRSRHTDTPPQLSDHHLLATHRPTKPSPSKKANTLPLSQPYSTLTKVI